QPARRQSEALVLSANTAMADGMPRKARELFLKALSLERQESGDGHRRLGPILSGLGRVSLWLRDYDAAETFLLEALSTYDSSPPLYGRRIETMAEVGYALLEIGKYEQAEKYLVQALELSRSVYGDVAFLTPAIISDLGAIHLARGHVDEAERLVRQAIELGEQARTELLELVHLRALLSEVLVAKGEHEMALRETETELQMLAGKVRS